MTELVSSYHSTSSASNSAGRPAALDAPLNGAAPHPQPLSTASAASRMTGPSSRLPHEDTSQAAASAAALSAASLPQPSSRSRSDRSGGAKADMERASSPLLRSSSHATPQRDGDRSRSPSMSSSKGGVTPHRHTGPSTLLPPLLPSVATSAVRDSGLAEAHAALSPSSLLRSQQQQLQATQPIVSSEYSAQRQRQRSSLGSARDGGGGGGGGYAGGLNNSYESFTLSPTRSTRDISATGLRGPIPESATAAVPSALQSPKSSHSGLRPTQSPSIPTHSGVGRLTGEAPLHMSAETTPLPPLNRSLLSLSSSTQGRRLTGALLDSTAAVAAAAAAATIGAAQPMSAASCSGGAGGAASRSSSINSMRRDDDGAQQASYPHLVVEVAAAAAQPPPPPAAPVTTYSTAAVSAAGRGQGTTFTSESVYRALTTPLAPSDGGGVAFDVDSRQPTSRFVDGEEAEEGRGGTPLPATPCCPTETEEVTFSMVPVMATEDDAALASSGHHVYSQSGTSYGGEDGGHGRHTRRTTALGSSSGHHAPSNVSAGPSAEQPHGASATGSAVVSAVYTHSGHNSSAAAMQDGARPDSGSLLKHSSMGEHDGSLAAATAARGATEARRPSGSVTEAVDPKAAKRRLKRDKKGRKARRPKQGPSAQRSDSEMQRRRQRKKQEKQEKLKNMTTEEQRSYRAEHQRRRAAKLAQRGSNAAVPALEVAALAEAPQSLTPASAQPSPAAAAAAAASPGAVNDSGSAAEAHLTQPPLSATPVHASLQRANDEAGGSSRGDSANSRGGASASLSAVTQSSPQLANTARPGNAHDGRAGGGTTLLTTLNAMRRCTSATGPSAPAPPLLAAAPPQGTSSVPRPFRRRFLSDIAPTPTPQYRATGFLCLPSAQGGSGAGAHQPEGGEEEEVAGFEEGEEGTTPHRGAFDHDDDDSVVGGSRLLTPQPLYGSSAALATAQESAAPSPAAAPLLAPHPPAAAAGSGAAAILELKQQHQHHHQHHHQQQQHVAEAEEKDEGQRSPATTAADAAPSTPQEKPPSVRVSAATSVSVHGQSPVTPQEPRLQTAAAVQEEASHSVPRERDAAGGEPGSEAAATGEQRAAAAAAPPLQQPEASHDHRVDKEGRRGRASPSSLSYYSSYSRSHDSRDGAANTGGRPQQQRKPHSPASSCSSFRSRSEDGSEASGSGSYSYSYTSSTDSSSGSSSGGGGGIVAEVLPLKEGCTTPPPSAAFHDLKFRYSCVAQLQGHAEPAVIHEWNLTEGCWGRVETSIVLNPQPFSKGNMRASYYMIDMRRLNCMLVAKRYLKKSVGEDQYFDDVSMHSISGHWARLFNAMHPPKKVRFVPAAVLVLPKRQPPLILAMEPLLTGKFVKYNNNCGYVRRNARWTPQAFSHFTYQASQHELMVVDIQGVDDYYTDPQILSPDGEGYGRGNLGKKGIRRFLESHKCNDVCRAVGLPPLRRNAKGVVYAPLVPVKSANSGSLPATPVALERLPPKAFNLSQRSLHTTAANNGGGGGNSGSERSPLTNNNNTNSVAGVTNTATSHTRTPSDGSALASPSPPRQFVGGGGSGLPSPGPSAVLRLPSGYAAPALGRNGSFVGPPTAGNGVKYVPYPRHAQVRPQSQYFTSTVAGGLMAVPPGSNGASAHGTPTSGPLPTPGGQPSVGLLSGGGSGGAAAAAVPLLRPPAAGRSGSGGGNGSSGNGGCVPAPHPAAATLADGGHAGVGAHKTGASPMGPANSPRLEPASGGVGTGAAGSTVLLLHPHPPKSRVSSLAGLSVGTPRPASLSSGQPFVSHTNSSVAIVPAVQSAQETPVMGAPHGRRQSFSRRPVFSAVEESSKSKQRRRRHH